MKPLAVVTRSGFIECMHSGQVCVTDSNSNIIYHFGDPNTKIFLRSSAKPFIAVAFVESGAMEKFGVTLEELAVICSSHSGQEFHRNTVDSILHKLGLNEGSLQCGSAEPYNQDAVNQLIKENKSPSPLFNCCSGKHAGMLALCKYYGYSTENYIDLNHPVQQLILTTIAELIGCSTTDIIRGIDNCSVPGYMISLHQHSYLYSLLASGYSAKSKYRNSLGLINKAMRDNPRMIIGDGEFDTELMKGCASKVIGKVGDDGLYCVSIPERNMGICIKIEDGSERAVHPVIIRLLQQFGVLNDTEIENLKAWAFPTVNDHKGAVIGNIYPVFDINNPLIQDFTIGQRIE
ncbi:MAG: L-asparaginase [Firmicutes bacterium HGW-Firmicutes-16]|nr:MAG: L-asparaginase [Firmicutes bacterium HGW-Firmicutes-16]